MRKVFAIYIPAISLATALLAILAGCSHVHHFGHWQVVNAPTCLLGGLQERMCECGEIETQAISATGHNYRSEITTAANCTSDGLVTYKCNNCAHAYTEDISATGHDWVSATCLTPKQCSACQITESEALGHTTDNGTCKRCGKTIVKPIVYSGSGNDVITGVNVPYGLYRVIMTNTGTHHFSVVTYDENGDYGDLLANESGVPFFGEALYRDGEIKATSNWSFEVKSKGNWTITIEPIAEYITSNIKGTGATVTGFFTGKGLASVAMTNTGKEHFSVIIYDDTGDYLDLLANDSGSSYSGKSAFKLNPAKYYFLVIDSNSEWTVDFGQTDLLTDYSSR